MDEENSSKSIIPKEFKELAKTAAGFLEKIATPPSEEIGGLLSDEVRFFRWKRQINMLNKAKRFLDRKGVEPTKVNLKTLVPILTEGSLEEDESMSEKWAALLANAADPEKTINIEPSFPHILKQLSPKEAMVLDLIVNMVEASKIPKNEWVSRGAVSKDIIRTGNLSEEEFELITDNLIRLKLCSTPSGGFDFTTSNYRYLISDKEIICLTHYGYAFVKACRKTIKSAGH